MKYHLRWGLTTLGRPEATLEESVRDADRDGFEFIEPRAIRGSVELQETLQDPATFELLCKIAAAGRVRVLGTSFGIASDSPEAREKLAAIAVLADRAGVPYLRIFGGCRMTDPLTTDLFDRVRRNLEWFDGLGTRCRLALETHDGMSSAQRCVAVAKAVGRAIPIVWDAHHTWRVGGEEFSASYAMLRDDIVDVHFKDSKLLPDGKHVATNLGEGDVPLDELFTLLEKNRVQYPVSLEYEKKWCAYLPELDEALEAWKRRY